MKKLKPMFKKSILLILLSALFMHQPKAQVVVEADGGVGYTVMNITSWTGREPLDWSQFAKIFNAQVLYRKSNMALGLSYGYNYLCWSYVKIPYGNYPISRTYEGQAQKLALLFRLYSNNLFFDFNGGVYLFDGYSDLGIGTSIGKMIRINEQLSIPVKLNWSTIFDKDATIMPISLSVGVSYQFH